MYKNIILGIVKTEHQGLVNWCMMMGSIFLFVGTHGHLRSSGVDNETAIVRIAMLCVKVLIYELGKPYIFLLK